MFSPHTPSRSARARVLGEVVAALNRADNKGRQLWTTTAVEYRESVRKAMTPVADRSDEPMTLPTGDDPETSSNVVHLNPSVAPDPWQQSPHQHG